MKSLTNAVRVFANLHGSAGTPAAPKVEVYGETSILSVDPELWSAEGAPHDGDRTGRYNVQDAYVTQAAPFAAPVLHFEAALCGGNTAKKRLDGSQVPAQSFGRAFLKASFEDGPLGGMAWVR